MDRYEEALEKARELHGTVAAGRDFLAEIFPELRESEDEGIRRHLIDIVETYWGTTNDPGKAADLAWLERQKESTWTEEDESFRKHSLPRILNPKGWTMEQIEADRKRLKQFVERQKNKWIEKKEEQTEELSIRLNGVMQEYVKAGKDEEEQEYRLKCYQLFWDALGDSEFFKQKEQKFTEKQDYSDLTDLERAIHRGFLVVGVENVPVTIIKETAQDCLAWMKPAVWSEEDEYKLNFLIEMLEGLDQREFNIRYMKELSSWLKSLRPPQYCENCKLKRSVENWKPSEEQMDALNEAVGGFRMEDTASCEKTADTLESLYNDLKKLM